MYARRRKDSIGFSVRVGSLLLIKGLVTSNHFKEHATLEKAFHCTMETVGSAMNGILKIELVDARALKDTDFMGKMDPYVMIHYKDQHLKSKVAKGQGENPVWNDNFSIWVQYPGENEDYNLTLRIMDKDTFTSDDFVGEARIQLKDLVLLGVENGTAELEPRYYNVKNSDDVCHGEIQVAFAFTLKDKQMEEHTH